MKYKIILFLLLLTSTSISAKEHIIRMLDRDDNGQQMVFEPAVLNVNIGDIVTFIPAGNAHDSISVFTPKGANTWHGKRDQSVNVTINKEGIYIYKCAPHFYMGMVGVIQAGKPTNIEQAKQFSEKISKRLITHKDRLINYLNTIE